MAFNHHNHDRQPLKPGIYRLGEEQKTVEICELIGRGGSCLVYRGHIAQIYDENDISNPAVLKEFYPLNLCTRDSKTGWLKSSGFFGGKFKQKTQEYLERIRFEQDLYDRLPGISVAKPHLWLKDNGTYYTVSHFPAGEAMEAWARKEHSLEEILRTVRQLCRVIGTIHREGLLFLDCKPDNLFVTPAFGVLICDFGSVMALDDVEKQRSIPHTPGWCPTEQREEAYYPLISPKTDVYSISAVLFWLLTGHAPETEELELVAMRDLNLSEYSRLLSGVKQDVIDGINDLFFATLTDSPEFRMELSDLETRINNLHKLVVRSQNFEKHPGPEEKRAGVIDGIVTNKDAAAHSPAGILALNGKTGMAPERNAKNGILPKNTYLSLEVSIAGSRIWSDSLMAGVADLLRYRIHFYNDSGFTYKNLLFRMIMPKGIQPIPGSVMLTNVKHPNGISIGDTLFDDSAINIGDYSDGAGCWIYFNAKLNPETLRPGRWRYRAKIESYEQAYTEQPPAKGEHHPGFTISAEADVLYDHVEGLEIGFYQEASMDAGVTWDKSVKVRVGGCIKHRVVIENTSDTRTYPISFRNILQDGMLYYVPESGTLEYLDVNSKRRADRIEDTKLREGLDLGDLPPKTNLVITFSTRAVVLPEVQEQCLLNTGVLLADGHELRDTIRIFKL